MKIKYSTKADAHIKTQDIKKHYVSKLINSENICSNKTIIKIKYNDEYFGIVVKKYQHTLTIDAFMLYSHKRELYSCLPIIEPSYTINEFIKKLDNCTKSVKNRVVNKQGLRKVINGK